MTATCRECIAPLGPKNRSGLCKSCRCRAMVTSPEHKAKVRAGVKAYMARPDVRARKSAIMAEYNRNISEAEREVRRVAGRRIAATVLARPDVKALANSPEARAKKGSAVSATRYAGIPEYLWPEARRLNQKLHIPAAEVRAMLLEQAAADEARRLAAMTSLERQLERIRNGATVSEKVTMRRPDHSFTLGGVAGYGA